MATRFVFFTGKGGVGKTTLASAFAVSLSDEGKNVLLVSTDPASNLDEMFDISLTSSPSQVPEVLKLFALNINPEMSAINYRERIVGPYRALLPQETVASIEEQLSGACTTEVASFDEFSKLMGDSHATEKFDHVVFDTAPTGHTLRLLSLPAAWSDFLNSSSSVTTCLGPLAGLGGQRALYDEARRALSNGEITTIVLVARPDNSTLFEAERTSLELSAQGISNQYLVLNGIFRTPGSNDPVAIKIQKQQLSAIEKMPERLKRLKRFDFALKSFNPIGVAELRAFLNGNHIVEAPHGPDKTDLHDTPSFDSLIDALAVEGHGIIMTMGKGGVGKTTIASMIAAALSNRGYSVHLTTTDPAGKFDQEAFPPDLRVSRIDPVAETAVYMEDVIRSSSAGLDNEGMKLLKEDLRSPCTQEIAVFRAFAEVMTEGDSSFIVIDTAPTGHTLLLLDAAESYHREVLRSARNSPENVRRLLPRLRNQRLTKVIIVTLPEPTPVHESAQLQSDLLRAGIKPYAWVVNRSLAPLRVHEPTLAHRRAEEYRYINEVTGMSDRTFLVSWNADKSNEFTQYGIRANQ